MPNFTLKDYLSEVEGEFEKLIGKIPERAIVKHHGKEFCVMCGHPTNEDEVVIKLKHFISKSITKAVTEALKEIVPEEVQGAESPAARFNYDREWYAGYNKCVEEIEDNIKKLIK